MQQTSAFRRLVTAHTLIPFRRASREQRPMSRVTASRHHPKCPPPLRKILPGCVKATNAMALSKAAGSISDASQWCVGGSPSGRRVPGKTADHDSAVGDAVCLLIPACSTVEVAEGA